MDERYGPQRRKNKKMTLIVVAALLWTVICLVGVFVEEASDRGRGETVPYMVASDMQEQPRIVSGFVPDRHLGPPPNQEEEVLSWDLINGLFAVIIFLELVVFPLLFWLWFGKEQHTESK